MKIDEEEIKVELQNQNSEYEGFENEMCSVI